MNDLRKRTEDLLAQANITLDGPAPTDMQILDERCFAEIFRRGRIAIGETYMRKWWDVEDLTGFIARLYEAGIAGSLKNIRTVIGGVLQAAVSYRQSRERNRQVATEHYNMDPRIFEVMLDKQWQLYSCGLYRTGATTIEEAETVKSDLTARKLYLREGQTLLDVGSGFTAGFLRFACGRYGVRGVGVVNSENQAKLSGKRVHGLPIDIRFQDWRDIEGCYDRIGSIGMFEHVGPGNHPAYFKKMRSVIADDGLMLLHCIGTRVPRYRGDPWFHKYIFPNGVITSLSRIASACEPHFVIEDVDNFGADYEPTLLAWFQNLSEGWDEFEHVYGSRDGPTFRMMKFYLVGVAGGFRARHVQLFQVVLSPRGARGGYRPVR